MAAIKSYIRIGHRTRDEAHRTESDSLPAFRPKVLPVEYSKSENGPAYGMHIRNPGYDALDVEIPAVPVGKSAYMLTFPERLALLAERTGKQGVVFAEAWLEYQTLLHLDGSQLHEVMRKNNVETINFAIIYKDTDFRTYKPFV